MTRDDADLLHAVEDVALTLTTSGMQRMGARVFALLLIYAEPDMTAKEIAAALQISPAAVSGAVRYLQQAGVLERRRRPGERVDRYSVDAGTWYRSMLTRNRVLDVLSDQLTHASTLLDASVAKDRLEETKDFLRFLAEQLDRILDEWLGSRG